MAAKSSENSTDDVGSNDTGAVTGTDVPATADPALAAPDSSVPADAPVEAAPAGATAEVQPVAAAPAQQVVYVEAPKPFVKKGNRGFGVLIAILSTVIFAVVTAVADVIIELLNGAAINFSFVTTLDFYAPVIMFLVGFVVVVLIVNRAGWAAHVLGSIFVGLVVYFGGAALFLLFNINQVPSNEVGQTYAAQLATSVLIVAALLGREVALWMGFAIASRGRKVKARNVDAKVLYDQEIAAKRAEYEQANAAAGVGAVASAPTPPAAPVAEPVAASETGEAPTV